MSAGKVRHWKHGWIPVSPEAKAYMAGNGPKPISGAKRNLFPKPGDRNYSPNNEFGLPTMSRNDIVAKADAEKRAERLNELTPPSVREPLVHKQFASQSSGEHYTGGVVYRRGQTDALVQFLAKNVLEGPLDPYEANVTEGRPEYGTGSSTAEASAARSAARIKNYLDLDRGPLPHYEKKENGTVQYTGGIVIPGSVADEMIKKLEVLADEMQTDRLTARKPGAA